MGRNFFDVGLETLLKQSFFNAPERAVLQHLHTAAKESAAVYWDMVTSRETGSDFDIVVTNIKTKCRMNNLTETFEQLRKDHP